ncbi:Hypothetical predicted protein [Marmota monax]|uniref:Uncharacterized protein n=1 Tax=Marmota monax TaxID=9995 RepID=A0A5E4AM71_MARMO|nr:hypothetical protein GHT09_012288 [Marmota monax]VTJ58424.1 Hypothetical predicted protein [Marmota monax]
MARGRQQSVSLRITAALPVQSSRPQHQRRTPDYSPKKNSRMTKRDHWHQHPHRVPGHPPMQKSQILLPYRTPGCCPCATTPMWTPTYKHGAPPVASILGLCSHCHSLSPMCDSLPAPGDVAQALNTANSHNTAATELISEHNTQHHRPAPPTRPDTPLLKVAASILGHLCRHL